MKSYKYILSILFVLCLSTMAHSQTIKMVDSSGVDYLDKQLAAEVFDIKTLTSFINSPIISVNNSRVGVNTYDVGNYETTSSTAEYELDAVEYAIESASPTAALFVNDLTALGCITIVASGGASENSSWTYSNNTILPNSGTNLNLNSSDVVAKMALGNLTVAAKCITVNANVNFTTNANSLTLKASGNVILTVGIQITTSGGDIIFWADADNNRIGGIRVGSDTAGNFNTKITSNGGDIILSGGSDPLTGYAHYDNQLGAAFSTYSYAIGVFGATLDARGSGSDGGEIIVRGNGGTTFSGIMWTVNIGGQYGLNTKLLTKGSGQISVVGDASETPIDRNNWAVNIPGILETESGAIHISGKSNVTRTNVRGYVVAGSIQSASGSITMEDLTTGTDNANYTGPFINGLKVGKGSLPSSSSDVTIIGDKLAFEGITQIVTSGVVVIESKGVSFTGFLNLAGVSTESSSLRIGKTTNTSNITIPGIQNIQGPITIHGANLALNAAITAIDDNINLHATGAVTQTGAITADGLGLFGTGTFTLTNTSNNVKTIAGGNSTTKLGSLSFIDASGGLEIGSVNPDGIVATGKIRVETLTGDLTIAKDVSTEDTTSDAIIINAGKSSAIGTITGGDIKISGTPKITMGSGGDGGQGGSAGKITVAAGIAKLFSGSDAESTGLSAFVGTGNTRLGSDETTTTFTPPLSSGAYALYRQVNVPDAPTITTITPGNASLSVAFTAPINNGGGAITNYEYKIDDGTWIPLNPATTNSPFTILNLTNGTEYTIQLRAVNSAGSGAASGSVKGTPKAAMVLVFDTNKSNPNTIILPLQGTVNVTVNWGDGSTAEVITAPTNVSKTYANEGIYTVTISGQLTTYGSGSVSSQPMLTRVTNFGDLGITNLNYAFYGASNLIEVPSTLPPGVTNTMYMFRGASIFNGDISGWNVSSVTTMDNMFLNTNLFNQNIGSWDVGNVTIMSEMFANAKAFNQNLTWNVGKVTKMNAMFSGATVFNGDIKSWDVSKVTDMSFMFANAKAFNQAIGDWNVSSVTNMQYMFNGASTFNQDLINQGSKWNVSNVTNMSNMFSVATVFNGDIKNWNVGNVTDMSSMFFQASAFNQDIGGWDVEKVTNMTSTFRLATAFNQNIGGWKVGNVTNMQTMFSGASSFNQDIGGWNVSKVTNMIEMFNGASKFNQDLPLWNVGVVNSMLSMFSDATAFNGDIKNWNVGNVTNMSSMFNNAKAFNQDIGGWNVGKVTNMSFMFASTNAFNQDIGKWKEKVANVFTTKAMFSFAVAFNQDIGGWNVGKVTDMEAMFFNATAFNQNIGAWDIKNALVMTNMFGNIALSTANYDALLTGWAAQTVKPSVNFGGGLSKYSCGGAAEAARAVLTGSPNSWNITDGGRGPCLPTAPAITSVLPGDASVEVYFTPGSEGGSPITNYEYSLDGGNTWIALDPADATSPITITGLTNGTEYSIVLRAVNSVGSGETSNEVKVTPITVPGAPTITTITPGNGTAVVAFTPPADNGGNAISNYEYTIDGTNWIALSPASTSSPFTISGLTNGTEYSVKLRAVNDAGSSAASGAVTTTPRTVPSAPTGLTATPGDGQIEIAFTPGNDGGSPVTNYQYSLDGGQTWITLNPADASSPITIPGLTNGTEYTVQIRAVNAAGAGAASDEVTATPVTIPSAPTNLVATVGDGQLTIDFTEGFDGGSPVTNYEYSLDGGQTWIPFNPAATSSPVTITNLENNTEYTVILRALNDVGAGTPSGSLKTKLNDYSDADGDGVPLFQEVLDGTDPNDATDYKDSDGDGVPDYIEARDGTDPEDKTDYKDSDGGGTPDYVESVLWPNTGLNPGNILDNGDDSRDTDGDGVPDYQELLDGTNPKDPADFRDTDGDGVPDYVELLDGTNPANPADYKDSDGDGVPDYVEMRDGTDPNDATSYRDTDGDQVPDYIEKRQGTDPANALSYLDSDGDLVPDYIEKRDGTDPADAKSFKDTDNGGVPDYVEVVYFPNQGFAAGDPNQAGDDARDSDGDGVSDYQEILDGTDPLDALSFLDDDKDGVPNQVEEREGTDPSDPLSYLDTDGDGVPDYVEMRDGTDPLNPFSYKDTDGDLVPDFVEARDGTDPADASKFKDTDKGGTPDYVESVLFAKYGLPKGNATDASDDARDTDGDGVGDYAELKAGTNPLDSVDYGFKKGTGSCIAPYDPFIVETAYHLSAMRQQPDKCYLQAMDIDARLTKQWNQGRGFTPIGSEGPAFSGGYDGGNYRILGLFVDKQITNSNMGDDAPGAALFGRILGSENRPSVIQNMHLDNVQVMGHNNVGALVGYGQWVTLSGVSSSGSVVGGGERVGGLVGHGRHVTIERSYSAASLTGPAQWKGGLAGALRDSRVTDSYFAGSMGASARSAGLVAYVQRSTLSNTYSAMRVIAGDAPSANGMAGMVADAQASRAENSYWDVTVSGMPNSGLGQFGTTVQMMDQRRYPGWDFAQTWAIASGDSVSYPYLRANQPRPLPGHRASSYVQVIHNMANGAVRVEIDDITRVGSLSPQGATPYLGIPSGAAFQIRLVSTSSGKVLVNYGSAPLRPGESRLIYAIGGDDELNAQIITYAQTKRESATAGQVDVVFVHGSTPYKELDLDYVTNSVPISVIRNIASGVSSGSKSDYTSLNYTPVKTFRLSSDGQTIGVFNFALEGLNGQAFKIVAMGMGSAKQANGITLVAVTADGRVIGAQLGTSLDEAQVPQGFVLHGNYPNPFNPTTSIRFDLPETAEVTIQVVDVLGRMVMNHRAGAMGAGANRTVSLDASRLASGVYLYRIVASGAGQTHTATGRFTLIK